MLALAPKNIRISPISEAASRLRREYENQYFSSQNYFVIISGLFLDELWAWRDFSCAKRAVGKRNYVWMASGGFGGNQTDNIGRFGYRGHTPQ